MTIAECTFRENLAEADQPPETASAIERLMKGVVPSLPFRIDAGRRVTGALGQLVEARDDVGLPEVVALFDRQSDGEALELEACGGDVDQLIARHRRNTEPLVVLENDEAIGREAHQGFAHRAHA